MRCYITRPTAAGVTLLVAASLAARRLRKQLEPGGLLVQACPVRRDGGRGGLDAAGRQPAEHPGRRRPDHRLGCLTARRGVVRAHRGDHLVRYHRWLLHHAGRGARRGVHAGHAVERDGDRARHRQGPVDPRLQVAKRRPGRRQRGRRDRVRGDGQRRGGPVGGHRQAVVEPDADRQRPRGHRHGPRVRQRHRVRVDRAGEPEGGPVSRPRQGDPVGAERKDRRAGVELGRGAGPVGESGPQLRRRPVGSAVVRPPGQPLHRRGEPRSDRPDRMGPPAIRGGRPGRARTCTPTRSSS